MGEPWLDRWFREIERQLSEGMPPKILLPAMRMDVELFLHNERRAALERAAEVVEEMVVGGRAWSNEQAIAAEALFAAAANIRALLTPESPTGPSTPNTEGEGER